MRFHHMAVFVSDLDQGIRLWRDVLGFELAIDRVIPDGPGPGPDTIMYPELLDDIFKSRAPNDFGPDAAAAVLPCTQSGAHRQSWRALPRVGRERPP